MIILLGALLSVAAFAQPVNDQLYQLDYRQRLSGEVKLPKLGSWEVQGSFETRYRPKRDKTPLRGPVVTDSRSKEDRP